MTETEEIELLRRFIAYDPSTGILTWREKPSPQATRVKVGAECGCLDGAGYRTFLLRQKQYLGHRVAWAIVMGKWPIEIDHKNGDRADNRWDNLRDCKHHQNAMNQVQPVGATGVRGVVWNKSCNRFQVQIKVKGKAIHIGLFKNVDDASAAYWKKKAEISGEFLKRSE